MAFLRTVKKHKIIFSALLILLCLLIVFLYQYIKWNRYYNEIWVPFIEIAEEKNIKLADDNTYTLEIDFTTLFFIPIPELFEYNRNIYLGHSKPFDADDPNPQYCVSILVYPQKKGDNLWRVFIDETYAMNQYIGVCNTYINPDTLEIISDDITDEERQIYQLNIEQVKSAVNEIREICYPLLN